MINQLANFITMPIKEFCAVTCLSSTTVRRMLADGELQCARVGKKRFLIVVQSYYDFLAKQQKEGVPEYDAAQKARAASLKSKENKRAAKRTEDLRLADEIGI